MSTGSHFVGVGKGTALDMIPGGRVAQIEPLRGEVREADQTIAAVAAANAGRYDAGFGTEVNVALAAAAMAAGAASGSASRDGDEPSLHLLATFQRRE